MTDKTETTSQSSQTCDNTKYRVKDEKLISASYHVLCHKGFDVATKSGYNSYKENITKERKDLAKMLDKMADFIKVNPPDDCVELINSQHIMVKENIEYLNEAESELEMIIRYLAIQGKLESQK